MDRSTLSREHKLIPGPSRRSEQKEDQWAIREYAAGWQIRDTFLLGLSEFNFLSADRNFKAGGTDFPTQRSIQQLVMYIREYVEKLDLEILKS